MPPHEPKTVRYLVGANQGFSGLETSHRVYPVQRPEPVAKCQEAEDTWADTELSSMMRQIVAGVGHGPNRARDIALIHLMLGAGLTALEVASLRVSHYLEADGSVRRYSEIEESIAFNFRRRPLLFTNERVVRAIDAYLEERARLSQQVQARATYRRMLPDSTLILNDQGKSFEVTVMRGKRYCRSIKSICARIYDKSKCGHASARDGRRLLARALYASGGDLSEIQSLMGLTSRFKLRQLMKMPKDGDLNRISCVMARIL